MGKRGWIAVISVILATAAGFGLFFVARAVQPLRDARLDESLWKDNKNKADYHTLQALVNDGQPLNWLFAGDSITHGCMHTGYRRNFSELFEQYIKTEAGRPDDIVINTGVSGATTVDMETYFTPWIENPHADVAFLCFGMNDCATEGITPQRFSAALRDAVARLREMGAVVILQTPNGSRNQGKIKPYLEAVRALAAEESVLLVDVNALWQDNGMRAKKWLNDPIHPNAAGHLIWARFLLESIGLPVEGTQLGNLPVKAVAKKDGTDQIGHWSQLPDDLEKANALAPYVENEKPVTWIFAGGVSTQGANGSYASRNFVQHLQEVLRWEIGFVPDGQRFHYKTMTNVARDGETVANLLAQYDSRIGQFRPEVLFLMAEPTDAQGNWVESEGETFRQELTQLIRRAQADGAAVIMALAPEMTEREIQFNRIIIGTQAEPGVAQETGVLLVGGTITAHPSSPLNAMLTPEGHFTNVGQQWAAASMLPSLVRSFPEKSRLIGQPE